jgi:hypothetical protein
MREIRQSGSEGGGGGASPYPYHDFACCTKESRGWPAFAGHDGWRVGTFGRWY